MIKIDHFATLPLVIATILLPFQIWPHMPLPGMQLSDIFFGLSFTLYLIYRRRMLELTVAIPLVAFAMGAIISTLLGGGWVKLLGHLELVAIGWMIASLSSNDAATIRLSLILASLIAAITALAGVILFYLGVDSVLLNIYGDLVADDFPRVRGTLVKANMLSTVVVTGLLLLWFEVNLLQWKILRWAIYLVGAIALVFSFSRTIVSFSIVFIGMELWRLKLPIWTRIAWLGVSLFAAVALWISIRYHVVLNPMSPWTLKILDEDGTRFAIWRGAVDTIMANPLFGIGPGKAVANGWSSHNTWLNLLGLIGVAPFIAFGYLFLRATSTAFKLQLYGIACAMVIFLIDSFSKDIEDMRHVWIVIGLALASGAAKARDKSTTRFKLSKHL